MRSSRWAAVSDGRREMHVGNNTEHPETHFEELALRFYGHP